jgi:hypothetical protein
VKAWMPMMSCNDDNNIDDDDDSISYSLPTELLQEICYTYIFLSILPSVEAGYNTSTVALRGVEGDEKEPRPVPGDITGPPCHWGTYIQRRGWGLTLG